MSLVLVHGRAQEKYAADALRREWITALTKGLERANYPLELPDILFPYYARTLVPSAEDTLRSSGISQFEREFHIEAVTERPVGPATVPPIVVTPAPIIPAPPSPQNAATSDPDNIIRGGATSPSASRAEDEELRGWLNWPITLSFARFLDERWAALAHKTVDTVLRDVGTYLTNTAVQREVDAIVRADIERATDPVVIVAHSLGSVVTFRVLHALAGTKRVHHLVTIGSPLGVRAVTSRLNVDLSWPKGVQRWTNGSDPRDLVALQAALNRESLFVAARGNGARADVENFTDVRNFTENHHSIEGYLEDPLIAARVAQGFLK